MYSSVTWCSSRPLTSVIGNAKEASDVKFEDMSDMNLVAALTACSKRAISM